VQLLITCWRRERDILGTERNGRTEKLAIAREKTCAFEEESVHVAVALMPSHTVHIFLLVVFYF